MLTSTSSVWSWSTGPTLPIASCYKGKPGSPTWRSRHAAEEKARCNVLILVMFAIAFTIYLGEDGLDAHFVRKSPASVADVLAPPEMKGRGNRKLQQEDFHNRVLSLADLTSEVAAYMAEAGLLEDESRVLADAEQPQQLIFLVDDGPVNASTQTMAQQMEEQLDQQFELFATGDAGGEDNDIEDPQDELLVYRELSAANATLAERAQARTLLVDEAAEIESADVCEEAEDLAEKEPEQDVLEIHHVRVDDTDVAGTNDGKQHSHNLPAVEAEEPEQGVWDIHHVRVDDTDVAGTNDGKQHSHNLLVYRERVGPNATSVERASARMIIVDEDAEVGPDLADEDNDESAQEEIEERTVYVHRMPVGVDEAGDLEDNSADADSEEGLQSDSEGEALQADSPLVYKELVGADAVDDAELSQDRKLLVDEGSLRHSPNVIRQVPVPVEEEQELPGEGSVTVYRELVGSDAEQAEARVLVVDDEDDADDEDAAEDVDQESEDDDLLVRIVGEQEAEDETEEERLQEVTLMRNQAAEAEAGGLIAGGDVEAQEKPVEHSVNVYREAAGGPDGEHANSRVLIVDEEAEDDSEVEEQAEDEAAEGEEDDVAEEAPLNYHVFVYDEAVSGASDSTAQSDQLCADCGAQTAVKPTRVNRKFL